MTALLEETEADAVNQLRRRSLFLADLSAQLHGELNAVLELGRRLMETDLTEPQRKIAKALQARSDGLLSQLADMSDFSNLQAGRIELNTESFALSTCVRATVAYHAMDADRKGLRLGTRMSPEIPSELAGDSGRLRQVLSYFVRNAIHSAAGDSIVVEPKLLAEDDQNVEIRFDIRVETVDESSGKILSRLFESEGESFFGDRVWMAIGFAICRDLTHLMGGEVGFEREGENGARFWFTTALRKCASREEVAPPAESARPKLPILLVSSDPERTGEVMISLLKQGYDVFHEEDRRLMEEILRTKSFGLVLMDGELPTLVATMACWAENRGFQPVPVVGVPAGAKGVDVDQLLNVVRLWSTR